MRLLLYNIRYATGGQRRLLPISGYLRRTGRHMQALTDFVKGVNPDIVGLVEVDAGSYRTDRQNQARLMADALGHYHCYRSKYTSRAISWLPVMNMQGNAFVTRDSIRNQQFHYFDRGVKRLVIELELEHVVVFLVHLSLSFRIRHRQLSHLYNLVKQTRKPHIVAGDFNALWGEHEIELFLAASGLANADPQRRPTYPSWRPRRHLDFILHSPGIVPRAFDVPAVTYSDHLPLVFDFDVA